MTELEEQLAVCRRLGADPVSASPEFKAGVSLNVKEGGFPVHGMRCNPEGETTGWFLYCEPRSEDPDFFVPLHVKHLHDWCPIVMPYLLLPPGWRFILAPGYEDAWFDDEFARHQGIGKQPPAASSSPLQRQVDQLDSTARGALEGALGLAAINHHHEVTLSHLLLKLIESSSHVRAAITKQGLDPSDLLQRLESEFSNRHLTIDVIPTLSREASNALEVATSGGVKTTDCLGLFRVIMEVPELRTKAIWAVPELATLALGDRK